jgi:hypothetical protein
MKALLIVCTLFLSALSINAIASGTCTGLWTYGYHSTGGKASGALGGGAGSMSVNESAGTQPSLQACANALVAQVQSQCNGFCRGPDGCAVNPAMHANFWTSSGGTQVQIVPMTCHS